MTRYYSNVAVETALSSGVSDSATTLPVLDTTGFPVTYPFTLILEKATANEELVDVTAVSGLNLTVTRGVGGTSAIAHSLGATVEHGVDARDFEEARDHAAASAAVHGLTGTVVGTSDTQTLTNKTLTAPTITTPTIDGAGFANAAHTHAAAASGGTIAHSALSGLTTGDDHTQYQLESEKAAANGYASLDADTLVPFAQLPTGTTASTVSEGDHTHGYTFSGAKAIRDTDQTITNSTTEAISFTGTDGYDTDSYHGAIGTPRQLDIATTGYYRVLVNVLWEGDADGRRVLNLRLNDTSTDGSAGTSIAQVSDSPGAVVNWGQQLVWEGALTAGDYLKATVFHTAGAAISLLGTTAPGVYMTIHRLG